MQATQLSTSETPSSCLSPASQYRNLNLLPLLWHLQAMITALRKLFDICFLIQKRHNHAVLLLEENCLVLNYLQDISAIFQLQSGA